jgi:hypothetical protein
VSDGFCGVGIAPNQWRTLQWGAPDVDFRVYWDGSWWQHEVRWQGLPSDLDCFYKYKVTSGVGVNTSTSVVRPTDPVTFFIPDPVPAEQ